MKCQEITLKGIKCKFKAVECNLCTKHFNLKNTKSKFPNNKFNNKKELKNAIKLYMKNKKIGIKKYGEINTWDVNNVTDMSNLFKKHKKFNQNINNWNVSNVENMSNMFVCCTNFNQPLDNWNVRNVKDMSDMFSGCDYFNQPLNN